MTPLSHTGWSAVCVRSRDPAPSNPVNVYSMPYSRTNFASFSTGGMRIRFPSPGLSGTNVVMGTPCLSHCFPAAGFRINTRSL